MDGKNGLVIRLEWRTHVRGVIPDRRLHGALKAGRRVLQMGGAYPGWGRGLIGFLTKP